MLAFIGALLIIEYLYDPLFEHCIIAHFSYIIRTLYIVPREQTAPTNNTTGETRAPCTCNSGSTSQHPGAEAAPTQEKLHARRGAGVAAPSAAVTQEQR